MRRIVRLLSGVGMVMGSWGQAEATLIVRGTDTAGNQVIYDTDLDITWYDFTNTRLRWQFQVDWVDALVVDFGGALFDDWRLSTVTITGDGFCDLAYSGTDCGYNVDTSTGEMAHLFYDSLGNKASYNTSGQLQLGGGLTNTGPFINLVADSYWSSTLFAPDPDNGALYFRLSNGLQYLYYNSQGLNATGTGTVSAYGLAVRSGDVSAVPEPATLFLLGPGLAGVVALTRRFVPVE